METTTAKRPQRRLSKETKMKIMPTKLIPIDWWMQRQPYSTMDDSDEYYAQLSSAIYNVLNAVIRPEVWIDDEELTEVSMAMAQWFEDIMAQTGIWNMFTSECKRRYNRYVPFYDDDSDYCQAGINLNDVRFLLWHLIEQISVNHFFAPHEPHVMKAAQLLFQLFNIEKEKAPVNSSWEKALLHPTFGPDDFDAYYRFAMWFNSMCYLNYGNRKRFQADMSKMMDERPEQRRNYCTIAIMAGSENLFDEKNMMLGLTTPEQLALLWKDQPNAWLYKSINGIRHGVFLYHDEDDNHIFLNDMADSNGALLNIRKDPKKVQTMNWKKGETQVIAMLTKYGDSWYANGFFVPQQGLTMKADKPNLLIAKEMDARLNLSCKSAYKQFETQAQGHRYLYFDNKDKAQQCYNKMFPGAETDQLFRKFEDNVPIMMAGGEDFGVQIYGSEVESLKAPDNPYYKKSEGQYSVRYLCQPHFAPYKLVCQMAADGLLDDAEFEMYGNLYLTREEVKANRQFLIDYFHSDSPYSHHKPTSRWAELFIMGDDEDSK